MKTSQFVRKGAFALALILCASSLYLPPVGAESAGDGEAQLPDSAQSDTLVTYSQYIEQYGEIPGATDTITVDISQYTSDMPVEEADAYQSRPGVTLITGDEGYVEWRFSVPQAGLYQMQVD